MLVRWSKEILGRRAGDLEEVQDSLAGVWIKAGYVEAAEPEAKKLHGPPADKKVSAGSVRRK